MELGLAVGEAKAVESSFPGQVRLQDILGRPAPQAPRGSRAGAGVAGRMATWAQGERAVRATALGQLSQGGGQGTAFPETMTRPNNLVVLSTTEQEF